MKRVLVTGIGKGLGKAFFEQFTRAGYVVYGVLRNEDQFKELSLHNRAGTHLILADLTGDDCIQRIRETIGRDPIDLVINNAGIGGETMTLDETSSTEILRLVDIHCLGVLRVLKATKENLLRSGAPTVINMNSRFGSVSHQYHKTFQHLDVSYAYRIAKAAQNMLTNCLRLELGDRITFVSVTPGKLITELAQTDANLTPEEGAQRIITYWESGGLKSVNGILQVPDHITEW